MTKLIIPQLGDFDAVEVIEVHIKEGDYIEKDDPLVTLETEKAAMDVSAEFSGRIISLNIQLGDKVSEGDLIGELHIENNKPEGKPSSDSKEEVYDLVVIGAGPGGYTAAFRAADLGLNVALVDKNSNLGGVCLNVGCIPSKAFLHAAKLIDDSKEANIAGVSFKDPEIDIEKMKSWKNNLIDGLTNGLDFLAKKRNVSIFFGEALFQSKETLRIQSESDQIILSFKQCIIAVGSEPLTLPFLPEDPRVIDSTGALDPDHIPESILIIGGGIIGLEMATIYSSLGSKVTIVELTKNLMPGTDSDLVRPLEKYLTEKCKAIKKSTQVISGEATEEGIAIQFKESGNINKETFDIVLVAIGRKSNAPLISLEKASIQLDSNGFIEVDNQMKTNVDNIYAIGDAVGNPMLAHKASHEGKIAAEVIAGKKSFLDARCIPSVAYTDPEVAWVGLTEEQCKLDDIAYEKGVFPWSASGRSLTIGRKEGFTKLLFDPTNKKIIGGGIVGTNAGDLIAEITLAIEMDCDVEDIALTVHPHPTLSETIALAAEAFEGTITELYIKN